MTLAAPSAPLEYSPSLESDTEAQAWLDSHQRSFGLFLNGSFTAPRRDFTSRRPDKAADSPEAELAHLTQASEAEITAAIEAARTAQPGWSDLGGHQRARLLYALARLVQKHARLFAVLESLDSGRALYQTRDRDIPAVARVFYHAAGLAQLMETTLPDRQALGVCGAISPWATPLTSLARQTATALAMGNCLVVKPDAWTSLTGLLLAELTLEAGLPQGVFNLLTGDQSTGLLLAAQDGLDHLSFAGATETGRQIRERSAGKDIRLDLCLNGKNPIILCDDADLDSAIEGIVDSIWTDTGRGNQAGARLLIQASIATDALSRLQARMQTLRVGAPLDKCIDLGPLVDPARLTRLNSLLAQTEAEITTAPCDLPGEGAFMAPKLLADLAPTDPLMQQDLQAPVLVSTTFRSPAEAIALANNSPLGQAAILWSENLAQALDLADQLQAGTVWINSSPQHDPTAAITGRRDSGQGSASGWESALAFTSAKGSAPTPPPVPAPIQPPEKPAPASGLDRTAKLYIGGKEHRPDSGYSRAIWSASGALLGHAPEANAKDAAKAVSAARKSQAGWHKSSAALRAQILYYTAENLSAQAPRMAASLESQTGATPEAAMAEIDSAIDTLFTWAAWADKAEGGVKSSPLRGLTLEVKEPKGVIAALCPEAAPLAGLAACLGPILAFGNSAVLVASDPFPLVALDFAQILAVSDLPAGVVNILTGNPASLGLSLAAHMDLDAIWSFSALVNPGELERASAGNLKSSWCAPSLPSDSRTFAQAATISKTLWLPSGA